MLHRSLVTALVRPAGLSNPLTTNDLAARPTVRLTPPAPRADVDPLPTSHALEAPALSAHPRPFRSRGLDEPPGTSDTRRGCDPRPRQNIPRRSSCELGLLNLNLSLLYEDSPETSSCPKTDPPLYSVTAVASYPAITLRSPTALRGGLSRDLWLPATPRSTPDARFSRSGGDHDGPIRERSTTGPFARSSALVDGVGAWSSPVSWADASNTGSATSRIESTTASKPTTVVGVLLFRNAIHWHLA